MNTTSNINLKVPFNEKDQAKSLGARWNAELKLWYVPSGVDAAPFEKWFTDTPTNTSTTSRNTSKSSTQAVALDNPFEDMDDINARLRDAYELREVDVIIP